MPVTVVKRPGTANFTDSPSNYVITASFTNTNQKLQVRLYVNDLTPKMVLLFPPYSGSLISFTINKLAKIYTTYTLPRITTALIGTVQAAVHSVKAWIDYRIFDPTSDTNPAFTMDSPSGSLAPTYIRGGYGLWANTPNFDFESPRKWFFTWQAVEKLVGENEPNWLLYCHPYGEPADIKYTVYYTDGTRASKRQQMPQTDDDPPGRRFDQWFIPTGVTQCSLQQLDPDKKIHRYRVQVLKRSDDSVFADFTYRVDYRPNYNAFVLYYRNSLGGWDSVRLLGEWEEANSYTRKTYEREVVSTLFGFDPNQTGAEPIYQSQEKRKWKANTGHVGKNEMDALRDLMISNEMAMIKNGVWIPLVMTSETLNGLNTKEMLQNVPLEFEAAYTNENYTPDTLPWT